MEENTNEEGPTLWSYIHKATFDLNNMTAVIQDKPIDVFKLVRGSTYSRIRGDGHLRGDPLDCDVKYFRRMRDGDEYGNKWSKGRKDAKGKEIRNLTPTMKQVLEGLKENHLKKMRRENKIEIDRES